jgi:hypothetical protein
MKRFAAARPMPVAPPVITAVFPFSLFISRILRWSCTKAGNCLMTATVMAPGEALEGAEVANK